MYNSKYLNEYRNTVSQNNALKITLLALVVIIFIEGIFVIRTMDTQRTIIIPSVKGKYVISDSSANKAYITQMGYYVTNLVENFTPNSIKTNYALFLNYVDPQTFGEVQAELNANAANYAEMGASSFFAPLSIQYGSHTIIVTGNRQIIIAGRITSDTKMRIKIKYAIKHGEFEVVKYEETKNS